MACSVNFPVLAKPTSPQPSSSTKPFINLTSPLSSSSHISRVSFCFDVTLAHSRRSSALGLRNKQSPVFSIVAAANAKPEPLRIMISGAPASGKGTQCELITKKYGLVHIAAGDLLRAEVAAGSENGKRAKEFMEKGQLVPNEIVVMMVKERLLRPDSQASGWLLDGYPRSSSQATALEDFGIRPDLFILLDVPEDILVERVVGRRLDPVTGKIYHLKYAPPETDEIAARLTQRFDDTEEKLRLQTHHQNVEAVLAIYEDLTIKIKGDGPKDELFAQIDSALSGLLEQKKATSTSVASGV
ncbi:Adenylate kinase [Macleaya cordata]|uniref:adenylate kinase n=1 Tax=Macleaya cordata TaxID=56857 RepID=A0A200Q1F5_MACCD|nr:Adenylate kinase [Macleaya cordata]